MAIATAIATGSTLYKGLKGVGDFLGIGGSKEEGSGTVQRGTLAHAIDKFEKANDYEALELANLAVDMRLQGATESQIANEMARQLGYGSGKELTSSWKWANISTRLRDAVNEARRVQSAPENVIRENPVNGVGDFTIQPLRAQDTAPAAQTDGDNKTILAIAGAALLAVVALIFLRG